MKIFIGHAGDRSRALAEELRVFVRKLLPATDPWVSTLGIEKGSRWREELAGNLEHAGAGIICLTSDNLDNPWILFESGALSQKPADRVWTFLLDVKNVQVPPPLDQFQHTEATKADVLQMIESINKTVETPRIVEDVRELFELLWPSLEQKIGDFCKMPSTTPKPPRSELEMMVEVLEVVRDISRRIDSDRAAAALAGWRQATMPLSVRALEHLAVAETPLPLREEANRHQTTLVQPIDDRTADLNPRTPPR